MEKNYKGKPLYDALLESEMTPGIFKVSLVSNPATEIGWVAFSKTKQNFAIVSEDQHKVISVIMLANHPIYRRTSDGFEYYIQFSPETLYEASKRMLANGFQNMVNLQHTEGTDIEGFELTQIYQKDLAKGINPTGFEEVEEGSLFGEYYVSNDEIWDEIKKGTFSGISLEGIFDVEPHQEETVIDSIEDLLDYLGISK